MIQEKSKAMKRILHMGLFPSDHILVTEETYYDRENNKYVVRLRLVGREDTSVNWR